MKNILFSCVLLAALPCSAISIMSFNTPIKPHGESDKITSENRWSKRKKNIVRFLKDKRPTILGCQEPGHFQTHYLEDKLKKKGYKRYGEANKEFSLFGIDALSWVPLIFDRDVQFNPLFWKKHDVECLDRDTFWLSGEKWEAQDGTSVIRICSWARFKDKKTSKEFYVFNTHLDHNQDTDDRRIEGIKRIIKEVEKIGDGIPIFIIGDFNTTLWGTFGAALSQAGFVDTRSLAQAKTGPDATYVGWKNDKSGMIDHILVKNGSALTVTTFETIVPEKTLSDHHPVMINFEWR